MVIMHFDIESLITAVGMFGVWAIVFAESGLLIGFFLPGDSLLFTSGFLASQGYYNVYLLAAGAFVAAVIGDNVGYSFGHKIGRKLFQKEDSLLFHKNHLTKAEDFYKKHGKKTIIIARFIPIVRTFAPIVAGMGNMEYKTFFYYNVVGGLLWAIGLTFLGYILGNSIPGIKEHIDVIIIGIIVLSLLPNVYHFSRDKDMQKATWQLIRKVSKKFFWV